MKTLFRRMRRWFKRKPDSTGLAYKTLAYHKLASQALTMSERLDQNMPSILAHAGDIKTMDDFKIIKEDFSDLRKKHKYFEKDLKKHGEVGMILLLSVELPLHDMKEIDENLDRNMKTLNNFIEMMNHVISCTKDSEGCK